MANTISEFTLNDDEITSFQRRYVKPNLASGVILGPHRRVQQHPTSALTSFPHPLVYVYKKIRSYKKKRLKYTNHSAFAFTGRDFSLWMWMNMGGGVHKKTTQKTTNRRASYCGVLLERKKKENQVKNGCGRKRNELLRTSAKSFEVKMCVCGVCVLSAHIVWMGRICPDGLFHHQDLLCQCGTGVRGRENKEWGGDGVGWI